MMWYRGVIVELTSTAAVILSDEGQFLKIKIQKEMEIGQTILFLEEDLISEKTEVIPFKHRTWISIMTAVAACLLLLIIPQLQSSPIYAVLSVDINPSFELELDQNQNIIKVVTLNDSASMLDFSDLAGVSLNKGLLMLEEMLGVAQYSLNENAMLFSLAFTKDENVDYEEEVKESLQQAQITRDFVYLKVSNDELKQARTHHISGAKVRVSELLNDIDVSSLSVNQIIELFHEFNLKFDMHCHDGQIVEEIENSFDVEPGCPMH